MINNKEFKTMLNCVSELSPRQRRLLSLKLRSSLVDHSAEKAHELISQEELDMLVGDRKCEEVEG
ncbi:hypothetical protein F0231_00415 [Vibrio sp. RE86]|uniref:hypothetical protein n=1 Tax=Vibrio sp. RE86 TaxID=2607605 RepID=UPI001493B492|nr:hypothetical protein [Vibrio sp. RE86]NOH78196.1 hypothetical protein [Vibrio sp. RE86]